MWVSRQANSLGYKLGMGFPCTSSGLVWEDQRSFLVKGCMQFGSAEDICNRYYEVDGNSVWNKTNGREWRSCRWSARMGWESWRPDTLRSAARDDKDLQADACGRGLRAKWFYKFRSVYIDRKSAERRHLARSSKHRQLKLKLNYGVQRRWDGSEKVPSWFLSNTGLCGRLETAIVWTFVRWDWRLFRRVILSCKRPEWNWWWIRRRARQRAQ